MTSKDYFVHGLYYLSYGWIKYFPPPVGDWLRYWITKPFIGRMGKAKLREGVTLNFPHRIFLGNNVSLNEWVFISGYGEVRIGNHVRIGHRSSIISSDHQFGDREIPVHRQGFAAEMVVIEDDVWIGCNVTILKGVHIGRGAVVAAGAVVTENVEDFAKVGGVPARCIGMRGQ